jgi:membrane-bound ClpP family serine protease
MEQLRTTVITAFLTVFTLSSACLADTFTNRRTGQKLHGYATSQTLSGETLVNTIEKGAVNLSLPQWQISPNRLGRNNKVVLMTLDEYFTLQIEAEAMQKAMARAVDQGPLFIVVEIDTPGGTIDLIQRICGSIQKSIYCPVIAFVSAHKYKGAISGGAAIAMACDKIYMAENAVIGAAALVAQSASGPRDLKKTFGEEISEKLLSSWRTYLATLAEHNKRPGLLAMAMADQEIEVIEVLQASERLFIEPAQKTPQQNTVRTWSKRGSLLTLTAQEAVKCGIADKLVASRQQLLQDLRADNAELIANTELQKARRSLERAKEQVRRLRAAIDLKSKQLDYQQPTLKTLRLLRGAKSDYEALIRLAKRYPDLKLSVRTFEIELNSVEAAYDTLKRSTTRRKRFAPRFDRY